MRPTDSSTNREATRLADAAASTHTPLPWAIHSGAKGYGYIRAADYRPVCAFGSAELTQDESEANAHLIIGAANSHADMLAALQDIASGNIRITDAMLESHEAMMSAIANYCQNRARDAIAKATGITESNRDHAAENAAVVVP